jgi:tetratricopeptide (TPR) repeat protein
MKANPFVVKGRIQYSREAVLQKYSITATLALVLLLVLFVPLAYSRTISEVPDVANDVVTPVGPIFHDSLLRGIELVFNDQLEKSLAIFHQLQQTYPDHPAPHFFQAAAYQSWMSNFRLNRYQKELQENIQLTISKGNKLLKHNEDPWSHFYVGAAYGYRALNRFQKHDWIGAYIDGKRGIKSLSKALDKEPNLFDVYLGLGLYHYWRTARSPFIQLIAFWIPDKRELGLRQLEFVIDHGLYAPNQASYALVVSYFDYGQYEKAMRIYDGTIGGKRTLTCTDLYYKGRLLIKFKKWAKVETLFKIISQQLEASAFVSVGYQVECKYWTAFALFRQNKLSKALEFVKDAKAQSGKRNPDLEGEGPFESFKEIKKRLGRLSEIITVQNVKEKASQEELIAKKIKKTEHY